MEIKATQGNRVALRHLPERLLVLKLHLDGTWTEIYNGPSEAVWSLFNGKVLPSNGQYSVGLGTLKNLMVDVPDDQKIPPVHKLATPI